MLDKLNGGNLPVGTASSQGGEYGYTNPPIRAFFFAKSVDPLFKSETTITSENRSLKDQR